MFIVYAIYNRQNDKIYIGQTKDLDQRIKLHNNSTFRGCYTSRFGGRWELIYKEEVPTCQEALKRERQLKSFRGREFVKTFIPEED